MSDYYGGDRYAELDAELLMDPREYIAHMHQMSDNQAAMYRGLQEYATKRDNEIATLTAALDAATRERDAFERDYTAVGERNKGLHEMYMALAAERDGLRAALNEGEGVFRCAGCGTWWDSGWPNNEGECPECGTPFPEDANPTHMLVPIVARDALTTPALALDRHMQGDDNTAAGTSPVLQQSGDHDNKDAPDAWREATDATP